MKTVTKTKMEAIGDHIAEWLRQYALNAGMDGFVIGVSGGIDSAVCSTLCAKTGLRTIVVEMPIHQDPEQVTRGTKHISWLKDNFSNVTSVSANLTEAYDSFVDNLNNTTNLELQDEDSKMLTLANTRSRMRMVMLYSVAGLNRLLVCGTGNKVEDYGVGFFTKYGDGGVDVSPIGELVKSEVYSLGKTLGVIQEILEARPTDGLWDDGRTDEDQIGCTYDELEWAMKTQEEQGNDPDMDEFSYRQKEVWKIYISRHFQNKHKMEPIPICAIPDYITQMGDDEEVLR